MDASEARRTVSARCMTCVKLPYKMSAYRNALRDACEKLRRYPQHADAYRDVIERARAAIDEAERRLDEHQAECEEHARREATKARRQAVGEASGKYEFATPEPIPEGRKQCPACHKVLTPTPLGYFRKHTGPSGARCWNKNPGDLPPVVAPPVVAPPVTLPPIRAAERVTRLDAGSKCRECGKWLPGERSLCGRCAIRSNR